MAIHLHFHVDEKKLDHILQKLNQILMTQAELAQLLRDAKVQADKGKQEILDKIAALEQAVTNAGNVSQDVQDAFADLRTSVQGIDDIVPDQPQA